MWSKYACCTKVSSWNSSPRQLQAKCCKSIAIFEPSTIAADRMYFDECKDAAGFLHLVHVHVVDDIKFKRVVPMQWQTRNCNSIEWWQSWISKDLCWWTLFLAASKDPQLRMINPVTSVQCSTGPYTLWHTTSLIEILLHEQYQSDGRFWISTMGYAWENIENHEPSEGMIWHQWIRQNSKHITEAEKCLLLDAESFLGDIDPITLKKTSTNVSTTTWLGNYLCHKETETLWRMLLSTTLVRWTKYSAYIEMLYTGGLKNRSTVAKGFVLLDASSNVIMQAFNTGFKKCRNCDTSEISRFTSGTLS